MFTDSMQRRMRPIFGVRRLDAALDRLAVRCLDTAWIALEGIALDCGGLTPLWVTRSSIGDSTPLFAAASPASSLAKNSSTAPSFVLESRRIRAINQSRMSWSVCDMASHREIQSGVKPPHSKTVDCGGLTPLWIWLHTGSERKPDIYRRARATKNPKPTDPKRCQATALQSLWTAAA
jgi:hypothetical protein